MLRALHALPRHRRPGDRRQLRPRRLPDVDRGRRARGRASRGRSPATTASSSCRRSRCEVDGERARRVNDVVVDERRRSAGWSSSAGRSAARTSARMPCDGLICSTPSGSTAYNLSNGGPVLVWGLDAMAVTFVAPHSLHARPLVVAARTATLDRRRTARADVRGDGARRRPPASASSSRGQQRRRARSAPARSLLATLPGADVLPPLRRHLRTASGYRTES